MSASFKAHGRPPVTFSAERMRAPCTTEGGRLSPRLGADCSVTQTCKKPARELTKGQEKLSLPSRFWVLPLAAGRHSAPCEAV